MDIAKHILNQLRIDYQSQSPRQKAQYPQRMRTYSEKRAQIGDGGLQQQPHWIEQEHEGYTDELQLQDTDRREYDDDAIIILEGGKKQHVMTQLQHFQQVAESRGLQVQWGQVELVAQKQKHGAYQTTALLRYNTLQTCSKIIGGIISIGNEETKAIHHIISMGGEHGE